jgi:hypothetical protein
MTGPDWLEGSPVTSANWIAEMFYLSSGLNCSLLRTYSWTPSQGGGVALPRQVLEAATAQALELEAHRSSLQSLDTSPRARATTWSPTPTICHYQEVIPGPFHL